MHPHIMYPPLTPTLALLSSIRKPPSPEVIASLLLMKSEPNWSKLEDEGEPLCLCLNAHLRYHIIRMELKFSVHFSVCAARLPWKLL